MTNGQWSGPVSGRGRGSWVLVCYDGAMAFGRGKRNDEARAAAYGAWLRRREPLAVASFVLGLVSLIEFGAVLVFGIAGAVLGVAALARLKRSGEGAGHVLAGAGIGASIVSLAIAAHFVYRWI